MNSLTVLALFLNFIAIGLNMTILLDSDAKPADKKRSWLWLGLNTLCLVANVYVSLP